MGWREYVNREEDIKLAEFLRTNKPGPELKYDGLDGLREDYGKEQESKEEGTPDDGHQG